MTVLHSFKDSPLGRYANLRMDNGDPVFVSIAQTGVLVKKTRFGIFGPTLYAAKQVHGAAMTAKALHYLFPKVLTPPDIQNPVLRAFTNAALHCHTVTELTRVLNTAIKEAEQQSGSDIESLPIVP